METEPTAEKRQHQAFEFLRNHARSAHIAGDGLLVGSLCSTGLQHVEQLGKEKKLLLPFSDFAWMPIFALYWLILPSERYTIRAALEQVEHRTDEDRLLGQWIDRYLQLIEQPLAGDAQHSPPLQDFQWPSFFAEHSPEVEALISHMVELEWFHAPSGGHWKQITETWLRIAPSWTHQMLTELKCRLELQARLAAPGKPHDLLPESEAEKLRTHYDISELWLLNLHGRSKAVCEAAERLAPFLSAESPRWRVLHDFIHVNSTYQPSEDSQSVRLARRRRLSVETPLLIFNDKREARLTAMLCDLFREHSGGAASKRWEIYLLAQLHELAALRLWDYGMWLEAVQAQAQVNLEAVQWTNDQPSMSAGGLVLSVHSFCAKAPDKDSVVRHAIDTLEFAPSEVLTDLSNGLLATYPRQKHQAMELLKDVTDLLPPETWPALARWTMSYIQESSEQRTHGWMAAPAKHWHWHWTLPLLPAESSVWPTLQPEALRMANRSFCWHGDDKAFLKRWLLFAPLPLAREVAEAMAVHPETGSGECLNRAEVLIEFEEWNPSLRGTYTQRLLSTAQSLSEGFILAKHLDQGDLAAREASLHERVTQNIREAMIHATPKPEVKQFNLSFPQGIHLVSHWRPEDQPLLEELIAAVHSPNVLEEWLGWLLTTIQLLVADGPEDFAKIVQPHVVEWTRQLPHGRRAMGDQSGPFSIMQWSNGGKGETALMLGWLAFQLPRKLGAESHPMVLTWARQMLLMGEPRPLDMAIYGSAVVALQTSAETAAEPLALMETAIISLNSRADHDLSAMGSLANALRKVSSLIDSEFFKAITTGADSPSTADAFVTVLSKFIPRFAKSPRAPLRAAVAALVWRLQKRGRQESWVIESLETLQRDHRARVRFEAQGGWEEARNRAVER